MRLHLDGAHRAQVGLEHILQTLSGIDVDLQSFAPPLRPLASTTFGELKIQVQQKPTRDSALGLRSCAADILTAVDRSTSFESCAAAEDVGNGFASWRSAVAACQEVGHFFLPGGRGR